MLPQPLALGRKRQLTLTKPTTAHGDQSVETVVPGVGVGFNVAAEHDAIFAEFSPHHASGLGARIRDGEFIV